MANTSEELERLAKLRDQGVLTDAEFQAEKAKLLGGGGSAPQSAAPKPDKAKNTAIGCIGLVVILIVLIVLFGPDPATTPNPAAPAAQPVAVTAVELSRAYGANEAAAQSAYGSTPLLVSGEIAGIDLDLTNDPVVKLKTDNEFSPAQASLADAAKPAAATLAKGQKIKLLCESVSEVIGTPMLRNCTVQ